MSEEEKKAIDDLFALTHINGYIDLYTQKEAKIHTLDLSKWQNGVKVLLNLIDKQQKEIKDLKEITQNYNAIGGETFGDDRIIVCSMKYFNDGFFKKNYIFKDKIREKIEHYNNELEHIKNGEEFENEKPMYYWGKVALEDLLEKKLND